MGTALARFKFLELFFGGGGGGYLKDKVQKSLRNTDELNRAMKEINQ